MLIKWIIRDKQGKSGCNLVTQDVVIILY